MLKQLRIKNFALIDDIEINLFEGLNVMTGETGAGKSIVLESLSLLFGKRSDQEMIRHGFSKAIVFGKFLISGQLAEEFGQELTIQREIDLSGKHVIRINDETITLGKLREVTKNIGAIHSQNETLALLDKELYLSFIDLVNEKEIEVNFTEYQMKRSKYLELVKKHKELLDKKKTSVEKKDYLEFQVNELGSLKLKENEKEELKEIVNKLSNFDRIKNGLLNSYNFLENDNFSTDSIYESKKQLEKIAQYDEKYQDISRRLDEIYYELDDVKSALYQELENFDFDADEFNSYQERIHALENIESKYHMTTREIMAYFESIKEELALITDYDGYLEDLKKEIDKSLVSAKEAGKKLSAIRRKNAKRLELDIITELSDLDLPKTKFYIDFKESDELLETGIDEVEFMITLNEAEIERPLHKVASGGERSRFLFSLKSLFALYNKLSLLVLDEIDIGISGKTASLMAKKMAYLSEKIQLIVITHLPQVAAKADHHFGISKVKYDGRMTTIINELSYEDRVVSLATMLSDERISNFAIEQAKTMLKK